MPEFTFLVVIILALATYRLCRLLIQDEITEPLRNLIWSRFPPESTKLGYWSTCFHCTSVFFGFVVVGLYLLFPLIAIPVCAILAISAIVGFIDHKLTS